MKLEKTDRRKSSNRRGAATAISSNYDSLFVHRKNALYRRAAELAAITDCSIGIVLLSPEGELSQFSTAPMKKILRSYAKLCSGPHEIHSMESIQAKCIAAGGEGIGLRVDHGAGPGSVVGGARQAHEHQHFREDTLRLSSESQGKRGRRSKADGTGSGAKRQEPWEVEALEAIMRIGEVHGKRKLEVCQGGGKVACGGRTEGPRPVGVEEEKENEKEEEEEKENENEKEEAACAAP